MSDGDGHWFFIPVHRVPEFQEWNSLDTESEEFYESMNDWDGYRCDDPEFYLFDLPLISVYENRNRF